MTKPENSSFRRSKVGEQRTNRQTLVMIEGPMGGRSVESHLQPSVNLFCQHGLDMLKMSQLLFQRIINTIFVEWLSKESVKSF